MKKREFSVIILITLCFIASGFFANAYLINHMYNEMLENQASGQCHLTAVNIVNSINDSITVPINVSRSMAADELLKEYLEKEPVSDRDLTSGYVEGLQNYLNTYYKKFHYDSLFLVSAATGRYYHQDGIDRVLKPGNYENDWYFDFVNSNQDISLDVDNDEANHDAISLFIDCRIRNEEGSTIGVVGVGMKIQNTVAQIAKLANDKQLNAYIIDDTGKIQVSSRKSIGLDSEYIGSYEDISGDTLRQLLRNKTGGIWQNRNGRKEYMEAIRIPDVNWYLLINMPNISTFRENQARMIRLYVFMGAQVSALFLFTYLLFRKLRQTELDNALKDKLTGLYNRTAASDVLHLESGERLKNYSVLFMMDIDDFKVINDTGGHSFGDEILAKTAENIRQTVGGDGLAIRWGGDEFIGLFAKDTVDAQKALEELCRNLSTLRRKDGVCISGSFGAVRLREDMDFQNAVSYADRAMYQSKENGKKQITWHEE